MIIAIARLGQQITSYKGQSTETTKQVDALRNNVAELQAQNAKLTEVVLETNRLFRDHIARAVDKQTSRGDIVRDETSLQL